MAVHVFALNEDNYKICVQKGIIGIPEAKDSRMHNNVFDGLLSRIACIKEDDYILMYIIKKMNYVEYGRRTANLIMMKREYGMIESIRFAAK